MESLIEYFKINMNNPNTSIESNTNTNSNTNTESNSSSEYKKLVKERYISKCDIKHLSAIRFFKESFPSKSLANIISDAERVKDEWSNAKHPSDLCIESVGILCAIVSSIRNDDSLGSLSNNRPLDFKNRPWVYQAFTT